MARIDSFLRLVAEQGASDLHFHSGNVPIIRHEGQLMPLPFRVLSELETSRFLLELLGEEQRAEFEKTYRQTLDLLTQARQANPQDGGVYAITGGVNVVFADRLPKEKQAAAWAQGYESYQVLWKVQGGAVDKLSAMEAANRAATLGLGKNADVSRPDNKVTPDELKAAALSMAAR